MTNDAAEMVDAVFALQSPSQPVVAEAVDQRSTMERLADILCGSSYKPTQRYLGAAFLGYDYARRLYTGQIAHPQASPPPVQSVDDRGINTKPVVDHESWFGVTQTVQSEVTKADYDAADRFTNPKDTPIFYRLLVKAFAAHRLAHSQTDTQDHVAEAGKKVTSLTSELATVKKRLESAEGVLRLFIGSAYPVAAEINPRGHNWSEAYLDQALAHARAFLQEQEKQNG